MNICEQLVKKVDVLVENFSPGTMDKLGLEQQAHVQVQSQLDLCLYLSLRPDWSQAGQSRF